MDRGVAIRFGPPLPQSEWDAFDLAFGRFMRKFGHAETILAIALDTYSGHLISAAYGTRSTAVSSDLKSDILRTLIGNRSTQNIAIQLRRCMLAAKEANMSVYGHEPPTDEEITTVQSCFDQLGQIRSLRNRLAHHNIGFEKVGNEILFRSSNRFAVDDVDKADVLIFKRQHLDDARADLTTLLERVEGTLVKSIGARRGVSDEPWSFKPSELIKRPYPGYLNVGSDGN